MESVAAFEPLLRIPVGVESRTGCHSRAQTVYHSRIQSQQWALAPQGTPLWKTTWFNFAPRLGVAYFCMRSWLGNSCSWWWWGFLRHRATVRLSGFQWAGICALQIISAADRFRDLRAIPVIVNPPLPPYEIISALPPIYNFRIRFSGMPASSRHWTNRRLSPSLMSVRTLRGCCKKLY